MPKKKEVKKVQKKKVVKKKAKKKEVAPVVNDRTGEAILEETNQPGYSGINIEGR